MLRSIIVFGTYHGASVMILSTLVWNISRMSMLELDAVLHSCIPYVHIGFRIAYTLAVCFPETIAICAQGSSTGFVVVGLGVFSLWLYVCTRLVGDPDVCLSILRRRVGLDTYCFVGQVGIV